MKIWILRHGQAEAQAPTDSRRELTAEGRQEVLKVSARLAGAPLDAVIASPYVRAQQTASLACETIGYAGERLTVDWLVPEADPRGVIEELDKLSGTDLLLVSHQPLVSQLISLLVEGSRRGHYPMPTAGLACVELEHLAAALATLISLESPVGRMV